MLKIFTIYDSKVGAYMNPIFLRSKGEAVRSLEAALSDSNHIFSKNPEDFTLFELGSWDESNSKFVLHSTPISIGLVSEFVKRDVPSKEYRPELHAASGT